MGHQTYFIETEIENDLLELNNRITGHISDLNLNYTLTKLTTSIRR